MGDLSLPYRRALRMRSVDDATVVGDLEDDFHHFRVTLGHHDGVVTSVMGEALRYPWTSCPDATAPLHELEGMALTDRVTAAAAHSNPRSNCTHLFDIACLSITHAHRGDDERRYDLELWITEERRALLRVRRDGEDVLRWDVFDGALADSPPYSDGPWRGGFLRWADATLEPEEAELAIVARRACDIGLGRAMDLDAYATASELLHLTEGACYTMRRGIAEHARRMQGTIRDFGDDPGALLRP